MAPFVYVMDKDYIEVGIVTKPHGVKGLLKIKGLTFGNYNFSKGKTLKINDTCYNVLSVSGTLDEPILELDGLTLDIAQNLKNKSVFAPRCDTTLKSGYFWVDLIGKNAVSGGKVLGKIDDIQNFGSADVIFILGEKNFSVASVSGLIDEVNETSVVFNKQKLSEVICYED